MGDLRDALPGLEAILKAWEASGAIIDWTEFRELQQLLIVAKESDAR